jgi:hypothetical protein
MLSFLFICATLFAWCSTSPRTSLRRCYNMYVVPSLERYAEPKDMSHTFVIMYSMYM